MQHRSIALTSTHQSLACIANAGVTKNQLSAQTMLSTMTASSPVCCTYNLILLRPENSVDEQSLVGDRRCAVSKKKHRRFHDHLTPYIGFLVLRCHGLPCSHRNVRALISALLPAETFPLPANMQIAPPNPPIDGRTAPSQSTRCLK